MATQLVRIQLLAKPASEWLLNDAVLLAGEIGAADVATSAPLLKMGDGVRPFSMLPNLLAPVMVANDYVAGVTTTLPPGSSAQVVIDNMTDPPTISFGIPHGATGATGPSNVLTVGTVTTGAPGAPADVTITGTSPAQVINFSIPQGQQGPQGIQGPQGTPGTAAFANPSAQVGLVVVNGVAATAMRSDAAPALNQAIAPTWTGLHRFNVPGAEQMRLGASAPYIGFWNADFSTRFGYVAGSSTAMLIASDVAEVSLSPVGGVRLTCSPLGAGRTGVIIHGTSASCYFLNGVNEDVVIRPGKATGTIYLGDGSTAVAVTSGAPIRCPSLTNGAGTSQFVFNVSTGSINYGTAYITGAINGYHGLALYDGGLIPTFMSNNTAAGIFIQGDSKFLILRADANTAQCSYTFSAAGFNSPSSRTLKRETGRPARVAELLARLRPVLFRLLKGDKREQLGLIAEEVAEVCPWLSDGKAVAYDRLAILLLCEWQTSHGITAGEG